MWSTLPSSKGIAVTRWSHRRHELVTGPGAARRTIPRSAYTAWTARAASHLVADIGKFSAAHLPPPRLSYWTQDRSPVCVCNHSRWIPSQDGTTTACCGSTGDGEIARFWQVGNTSPPVWPSGAIPLHDRDWCSPHLPPTAGVTFSLESPTATEIARGQPLMVVREFGARTQAVRFSRRASHSRGSSGNSGPAEHRQVSCE